MRMAFQFWPSSGRLMSLGLVGFLASSMCRHGFFSLAGVLVVTGREQSERIRQMSGSHCWYTLDHIMPALRKVLTAAVRVPSSPVHRGCCDEGRLHFAIVPMRDCLVSYLQKEKTLNPVLC